MSDRESHALVVRGWLVRLAVEEECSGRGGVFCWSDVVVRREIMRTFLRPIAYFGTTPILNLQTQPLRHA